MEIFDSHTHINAPQFDNDIPDVIERAAALDVTAMLVVGYDKNSTEKLKKLISIYPQIYGAVGCHPEDAEKFDEGYIKQIKEDLRVDRLNVLGEIGLDYHCAVEHKLQQDVFRAQLRLAHEINVPVTIHNRDAFDDVYRILKDEDVSSIGGIMHSFNGDATWAKKFLDLGMKLSYSGVSTFKNAAEVREAFMATPLDRILVETDAPYLAPVPFRGMQNEPGYIRYTLEYLAQLRGIEADILAKQTYQNTMEILGIK
ncbi:TatD family hydrolase [Liquorilactobacillus mali]|uniref:TatD family deoxyribonuclease n=1 Tax=Liquorilactobacillus mali KCTC 3596 = DSM 20444 TaxID=1046596 RepID=J1F5U2_9LACO|nr:TatD family hydrolase [Liquorilactobacillus mali]EJF02052.1 TatD family Dnase [Liquorilactobacillus mali KCTC 3596 = DSM 20444]KRN09939.1 TatD family deoxyribonuclease [Liquorilactobacillus mali KCTC 3596 = DSM 20444]MDC7953679.1 TatD family hydrolase [Liquorilactobacillus mali]MDV7758138.1 YchF/TatD family DNA exonuclease [Liquorilactobacillus mali]QFQ74072.1 TatD family deoxyribonuclease [Liquorilactobacillus mali]